MKKLKVHVEKGDEVQIVPVVSASFILQDDDLLAHCPALYEVLAPKFLEGKCQRQAGSLSFFCDGGNWTVRLSCPTEGLVAMLSVRSLVSALDELENACRSNMLRWGPDYKRKRKMQPRLD
jgi:hypothetical protein